MTSETQSKSVRSNVAPRMNLTSGRDLRRYRSIKLEREIKSMLNIDDQQRDDTNRSNFHSAAKQSITSSVGQGSRKFDAAAKWTERVLRFLGQFSRRDLLACDSSCNDANRFQLTIGDGRLARLSRRLHLHRSDRSEWFKQWVAPLWWPHVVQLVWTLCAMHMIASLVLMYRHDNFKFRLHRVRWLNGTYPDQFYLQGLETEQQLQDEIARSGKLLQLVWRPEMHVCYLTQNFLLCFLIMSTISFPLAKFYYVYKRPSRCDYLVELLDYPRATRDCLKIVKEQVRLFIKSSRNFTSALLEFSEKSIGCRVVEFDRAQDGGSAGYDHGRPLANKIQNLSRDKLAQTNLVATIVSKQHSVQVLAKPIVRSQAAPHKQDEVPKFFSQRQIERDSKGIEQQLGLMLLQHHLTPMNHSPEWLSRLHSLFIGLILIALNHALLAGLLTFGPLLQVLNQSATVDEDNNLHEQPVQYVDGHFMLWWSNKLPWLLYIELAAITLITSITNLGHWLDIALSCIDQIMLARRLLELIKKVIRLNTLRFYGGLESALGRIHKIELSRGVFNEKLHFSENSAQLVTGNFANVQSARMDKQRDELAPSARVLEEKMNNDLLLVIMHYRIFLSRQLDLIQPLGVLTLWLVTIMFMFPLISRLHQPYLMGTALRPLLIIYTLLVLQPCNMCLLLICYMHRRCLDLYVALNSIVAHATEVASSGPEGHNIYDRHQVSMLRKELRHHDGMASRLATKFVDISMTYPNLVRIYLYLGFLILSLTAEDNSSEEELSVTIFTDPLGLF